MERVSASAEALVREALDSLASVPTEKRETKQLSGYKHDDPSSHAKSWAQWCAPVIPALRGRDRECWGGGEWCTLASQSLLSVSVRVSEQFCLREQGEERADTGD